MFVQRTPAASRSDWYVQYIDMFDSLQLCVIAPWFHQKAEAITCTTSISLVRQTINVKYSICVHNGGVYVCELYGVPYERTVPSNDEDNKHSCLYVGRYTA